MGGIQMDSAAMETATDVELDFLKPDVSTVQEVLKIYT